MVVLLPNTRLGLRRRADAEERNSHGERVPVGWGGLVNGALFEGRTKEQTDGTWTLGLDPSLHPVRQGDMVISEDGDAWIVTVAALLTNNYDSSVNWIRTTAQKMSAGGTEPGGQWFVARYADSVNPEVPDPDGVPTWSEAGLWTGYGPPPDADFGADVGDEYLDLLSGTVYQLN